LRERREATILLGIVFVTPHEHADAPHAVALLRPRHYWPRTRQPHNELSASHPGILSHAEAYRGGGCKETAVRADAGLAALH
jgi:hypothetical protein